MIMILHLPSFLLSPFIGGAWAITLGPVILIKSAQYIRDEEHWLIPHEELHQQRQKAMGVFKWWWNYATDKHFRLKEEVLAYQLSLEKGLDLWRACQYLKNYGIELTDEQAVSLLKGTS